LFQKVFKWLQFTIWFGDTILEKTKDEETTRQLVNYFGSNYKLLKILYPNRTLSLHELAREANKDPSNLSKLVSTLATAGILETETVSRERGRPHRYIRLSKRGHHLISSAIAAARIPAKSRQYDPSAIDLMLDITEDTELDEETRNLYANSMHTLFIDMPIKTLTRHERLRKILEKMLEDLPSDGEVEERKRSMIKMAIPQLIMDKKTKDWVLEKVYPNALRTLENRSQPEKILKWAIFMLTDIGTRGPTNIWKKIKRKLLEIYFDDGLEPTSEVAIELQNSILELFCLTAESSRQLATYLRKRATSVNSKEKEKAATVLKKIIQYLVPAHGQLVT